MAETGVQPCHANGHVGRGEEGTGQGGYAEQGQLCQWDDCVVAVSSFLCISLIVIGCCCIAMIISAANYLVNTPIFVRCHNEWCCHFFVVFLPRSLNSHWPVLLSVMFVFLPAFFCTA